MAKQKSPATGRMRTRRKGGRDAEADQERPKTATRPQKGRDKDATVDQEQE